MSDSETSAEDISLDYDVVVVGAGIAGLSAVRELKKRVPTLRVLILEAKNRVGGRLYGEEVKVHKGNTEVFDLGGQWVGRTQTYVLDLLKDLNFETYDQYAEGDQCAQVGSTKLKKYNAVLPTSAWRAFSIRELVDMAVSITRMERIVKKINIFDIFQRKDASKLNEKSVTSWARENTRTRTTMDLLTIASKSIYGVDPNSLNMLFHSVYAKGAGSFMNLCEHVGDGAQALKIKGGAHQICPKLAKDIDPDHIMMSKAVTKISIDEKSDITTVYYKSFDTDNDLQSIRCSQVILAIPPTECRNITYWPALPYEKRRLFETSHMGHYIKFVVTFQTAFWREQGLSGEILSSGYTEIAGDVLPIIATYDATTAEGAPAIIGFINEEFTDMTMEERCNHVVRDLMRFLGEDALNQFIDYKDKAWIFEPYNGGCPAAILPPGQMDAWLTIRDPHLSIHFAGTETSTQWIGYMDGGIESGLRTAHEVLKELGHHQHVNYLLLKDTHYSSDYTPPRRPTYSYENAPSKWPRRLLFFGLLIGGVIAYSKKYELSYTAKAVKPVENALLKWFYDIDWPT